MKDQDFIFKIGKTPEEKINNLNGIISLLSMKLEMELKYINIESIIQDKDKESVKYFLILFINILKIKEIQKEKLENVHFNNEIELLKRSCITDRDEKDNKNDMNKDMNISFDLKLLRTEKEKENNDINVKFNNYLKKISNNVNNNLKQISGNFDILNKNDLEKKTDLRIFLIPPLKPKETIEDLKNRKKFYFSSKKKNFHIYLSQKELIYEVVQMIKKNIPHKDFYNFLVSNDFTKKMLNIIKEIYSLHFLRHNNIFISKHYLKDHEIDIISIIKRELGFFKKYNKSKNKGNNKSKSINQSNKNIERLSKIFKNIVWLKKFNDYNCERATHEIYENQINYEKNQKMTIKYINDYRKLFLKLISLEKNKNSEDKEHQQLLINMKYYQNLEQKADLINSLRKENNKLKILIKNNMLI